MVKQKLQENLQKPTNWKQDTVVLEI